MADASDIKHFQPQQILSFAITEEQIEQQVSNFNVVSGTPLHLAAKDSSSGNK